MRILVITAGWPTPADPVGGIFIQKQVEALRSLGLEVDVLHFRGNQSLANYWAAYGKMRRMLAAARYDLVHAHHGQAGFIAVLQRQAPVVVTFHGSDLYGLASTAWPARIKGRLLRLMSEFAAARADAVVTVSARLARELPWRECHVIPMGTDLSLFTPMPQAAARQALGWSKDERSVLFVGDPSRPVKRYGLAAKAVQLASRTLPNITLRLCQGEPPERVPIFMNAADALLVTSAHEGGPLVIREALACNLPVVSVDVGDARERLSDIAGCALCEDDRPETIAAALMRVLRERRRVEGRRALEGLDNVSVAHKLVEVYAVIAEKSSGALPHGRYVD